MEAITRRNLLCTAAAGAAVGAAAGTVRLARADEETPWLPASWDAEADFVIVGYGGAGAAAAITAAQEGLGSAIVLEAAPEGQEGGNSRVCGQNLLIPQDVESAITYQRALNDYVSLDDDPAKEQALYEAWAEGMYENYDWLEGLGAEVVDTVMNSHEFPELDGNEEGATCYLIDGVSGNEAVWNVLKGQEEPLGLDVRYGTRATRIVRNPLTNEALGVEAQADDGSTRTFKANKAVILSCGGFENNLEMAKMYSPAGSWWTALFGTEYNRGDGFKMVAPFGAKLWHMNNFTGLGYAYRLGGLESPYAWMAGFGTKDYIYVAPNGKRYQNENGPMQSSRHGKILQNGVFQYPQVLKNTWTVFGQNAFDAFGIVHAGMGWLECIGEYAASDAAGLLEAGVIKKADTVEELAEICGLPVAALAETIESYNQYCTDGYDPDFHRGEPVEVEVSSGLGDISEEELAAQRAQASDSFALEPINAPFYAMEMVGYMGNTQGGPKRSPLGEVEDHDGNPVPRLYAAGEFGAIYGFMYNGGGNLSEALSSGRIAVRNAAKLEPWQ